MAALRAAPQLALVEERIDDPALLAALDDWQEAKADLEPYRKRFRQLDESAKALIAGLALADGVYRVGRFTVTLRQTEGTHVEFERASKQRTLIRVAGDDD